MRWFGKMGVIMRNDSPPLKLQRGRREVEICLWEEEPLTILGAGGMQPTNIIIKYFPREVFIFIFPFFFSYKHFILLFVFSYKRRLFMMLMTSLFMNYWYNLFSLKNCNSIATFSSENIFLTKITNTRQICK